MTSIATPAERVRALTDEELLAAYEATSGEAGDEAAETLLAEIQRRELDV